jgi:hypothetical protein
MMGQEASTLASEYGPQWMNMPNFASRYQAARSWLPCAGGLAGLTLPAANITAPIIIKKTGSDPESLIFIVDSHPMDLRTAKA